jgi:hypothetical protein
LTKRSKDKFSNLYFRRFGIQLTEKEIEEKARYLIQVYQAVLGMPNYFKNLNREGDIPEESSVDFTRQI